MEILDCFIKFSKELLIILLKHSDDIIIGIIVALIYDLLKKAL